MTNKTLTDSNYQALKTQIQTLIKTAKTEAQNKVNSILALAYWEIGKEINQQELTENSGYAASILTSLEADLKIEKTILLRCSQFHKLYPQKPENTSLSWSHFRQLIAVKDPDLRKTLESQATQNSWTTKQLCAQITNPELGTPKGQKAFNFLRTLAASLEEVVVRTNKVDIYGRFLGDVFYLNEELHNKISQVDFFERGTFLSEEMVRKGLAEVY